MPVGLDLLEIERLERALERRPGLARRLFTDGERAYAEGKGRPGQHLAARFCAKEAVVKALALEGALKLKELSYIPTEAYSAGEMKHGPIALLDQSTPVVAVATDSPVLEKLVSNMQEVRARGAHVIAVASEGNVTIGEHAEQVIRVPQADWMLQPLLAVIPLQLLAYGIARRRGLNVDQPRNLAKTVTVE